MHASQATGHYISSDENHPLFFHPPLYVTLVRGFTKQVRGQVYLPPAALQHSTQVHWYWLQMTLGLPLWANVCSPLTSGSAQGRAAVNQSST